MLLIISVVKIIIELINIEFMIYRSFFIQITFYLWKLEEMGYHSSYTFDFRHRAWDKVKCVLIMRMFMQQRKSFTNSVDGIF